MRRRGGRVEETTFMPVDSVRFELEAFAAAVAGHSKGTDPYPITTAEMGQTIAVLEAISVSIETGKTITLEAA
jgi:predicted dehydrogenase